MAKKHERAFDDRRNKFNGAASEFRRKMNSRFGEIYSPREVVGDVFFYGDRIQGIATLLAEYFYLFFRLASANPKFIKTEPAQWALNEIQPLIECQKRKMANWIWASPKNSQIVSAPMNLSAPALSHDSDYSEGITYFLSILENALAKIKADLEVERLSQFPPPRWAKQRLPNKRESKILCVIRLGLKGKPYCSRLDYEGVKGLARWQALRWPGSYLAAYEFRDLKRRAAFRKRIWAERTRIADRWSEMAKKDKH